MFEQQTTLKPKWQQRFDFFDYIENMTGEEKKETYKESPFFIKFNWLGFIFGSYYIIFLGAWRTGLVLWLLSSVIDWISSSQLERMNISDEIYMIIYIAIYVVISICFGLITNYIYYCYAKKDIDNPMDTLKKVIMLWKS